MAEQNEGYDVTLTPRGVSHEDDVLVAAVLVRVADGVIDVAPVVADVCDELEGVRLAAVVSAAAHVVAPVAAV
eukprot:CAMPEP_0118882200 /NCGR_PEP_ID=MMETSP1163-20130328/21498_1 /TAXON_ID=124430 /ORGANISM="Phaeomonas parva, Strain CCMP2877" /LENGTH=72 /DNA_ID=CAMNT_0006819177 /DNA_START=468 /DNA_END=683 /DNA_ORIENTATION=+